MTMLKAWKTFAMMLVVLNLKRFPSPPMARYKFTIPSLRARR